MTETTRLALPQVTLCCVDTRSVPLALWAVQRCRDLVEFGDALFMGPEPGKHGIDVPEGLRWITCPPLRGIEDYNRIMLRELVHHVKTSHVLIMQWDGFITDPGRWSDEFLQWDYIGAPWYHGGHPGQVGNGGFSLRSLKLLRALQHVPLDFRRPEDEEICVHQQPLLTDRWDTHIAPLALAQAFSCEYGPPRPAFGFHGMHNFAHVLDEPTLSAWLAHAPAEILTHKHCRKLVKSLMKGGRTNEAVQLVRMRARHTGWTKDQVMLLLRAWAHRFRPRAATGWNTQS